MGQDCKRVGPALLLTLVGIASACGTLTTTNPGQDDWGPYAHAKPVALMGMPIRPDEADQNMLVNLSIRVSEPVLSTSQPTAMRRAVAVNMVTYYSAILTNFGGTLELVDATADVPIVVHGGGSDPSDAMASARVMLGQDEAHVESGRRPRYEITIRPADGLTWGGVEAPDDISVSWKPFVPTR